MSISNSLSNALSGLNVASRMAEVVSDNLANSLTEGYARREVSSSSQTGGVKVDGILRSVDRGLLGDRRIAEAQLNADQRTTEMLLKVENLIGVAGSEDSIASRLTSFEIALVSASSDPSSEARLEKVNDSLKSIVDKLHIDSSQIQTFRQDADAAISRDVDVLNSNRNCPACMEALVSDFK